MLHEVPRHLVESLVRRYNMVVALKLSLQPLLDVDVIGLQFLQFRSDTFVEVPR